MAVDLEALAKDLQGYRPDVNDERLYFMTNDFSLTVFRSGLVMLRTIGSVAYIQEPQWALIDTIRRHLTEGATS